MTILKKSELLTQALPIEAFRTHMCLGTGFGNDSMQDPVLESLLRAALTAIEAQTGQALISRVITFFLSAWDDPRRQPIPVTPLQDVHSVRFALEDGTFQLLPATLFRVVKDEVFPSVIARDAPFPDPPVGAEIELGVIAGFGPWEDVPADLRQAVFLLAGHYYENRSATQLKAGCMPFGVTALLEPYRLRRIGFGSRP